MTEKQYQSLKSLVELVRAAIVRDSELRNEFHISNKFRFIQEKLTTLLQRVESALAEFEKNAAQASQAEAAEQKEKIVYVYLYNAQGLDLQHWQPMISAKVFYEYSVNRPIYTDKSHIDAFIRSRSNKIQHGYLTIAINVDDILATQAYQDAIGHPLIKLKEGALHFNQFISFTHNNQDYILNAQGLLVKK